MIRAMTGSTRRGMQLGAEHATFIQSAVSVVVSARDGNLVPDVLRGCGCRVTRDRRHVTVLVEPARADFVTAQGHLQSWVEDMQLIGYASQFARAVRGEPTELVAITFRPEAAFEQTPGPAAGQRLPA